MLLRELRIDALRLTVNDVSPEIMSETIYSHSLQGEGGLEVKVESWGSIGAF